jgi:hypothetical protein
MLTAIGLLLVAIGLALFWAARRVRGRDRFSRSAGATVVALRRRGHPADAFPVVRFHLPDGQPVEAQSTWGSRPARLHEGDRVDILYDPRDPTRVRLPGEATAGAFVTVALVLAGAGFVVLGALLAVVSYALG